MRDKVAEIVVEIVNATLQQTADYGKPHTIDTSYFTNRILTRIAEGQHLAEFWSRGQIPIHAWEWKRQACIDWLKGQCES